jgi:hypothetical protein
MPSFQSWQSRAGRRRGPASGRTGTGLAADLALRQPSGDDDGRGWQLSAVSPAGSPSCCYSVSRARMSVLSISK